MAVQLGRELRVASNRMNLSAETLVILLYLTPGLLASLVFDTIVVRPKKDKDAFTKSIEALVFSLIIYGCVAVFSGEFPAQVVINQNVETILNRSNSQA